MRLSAYLCLFVSYYWPRFHYIKSVAPSIRLSLYGAIYICNYNTLDITIIIFGSFHSFDQRTYRAPFQNLLRSASMQATTEEKDLERCLEFYRVEGQKSGAQVGGHPRWSKSYRWCTITKGVRGTNTAPLVVEPGGEILITADACHSVTSWHAFWSSIFLNTSSCSSFKWLRRLP